MKKQENRLFRVLGFCGVISFLWPAIVHAADEYNFDWMDQDKKIYVLQNRKFQKANRALLSMMVGRGISNPYRDTFNIDPRLAYYFSEEFGIEGFYNVVSNRNSGTFEALQQASPSTLPVVREIRAIYGGLIHWAPWYAKINVFNNILHFDWFFSLGAGQLRSDMDINTRAGSPSNIVSENLFAVYAGTGQQFSLSSNWVARLDFLGAFYRAPLFGDTGDQSWFSNYNFDVGIGLRL